MFEDILLEEEYINDNSVNIEKVTADLDSLFDNLSNDVTNINKIISDVTEKRKNNQLEEKNLCELKEKLEREKIEFDEYVNEQKMELRRSKEKIDQYSKLQQEKIRKNEEEFKNNVDTILSELEIDKKTLILEKEQFKQEKEQFLKYKEVAYKKIELENKNIEQKCIKFRELMNQFNSNFKPMLDEE